MKELKTTRTAAIFDIKAETAAAAMLAQDEELHVEQIIIAPKGTARRRSSHEIKEIKKRYFEFEEVWQMEINRKGLVDTLPENLFLRVDEAYPDSVAKAKAFARQMEEARKFFLPFEQATYQPRIETEQLEQQWVEGFPAFIEQIWGLPYFGDCLSARQRFLLCYLLPEAHRITGDWTLTRLCFEAVLRKVVNLNFVAPPVYEIPGDSQTMDLGDLVLGESFKDDIPALEISVEDVTLAELDDYLPGGKRRRVLEELLYNYFLPLDTAVITRINVSEDAWGFVFGQAVLGYNVRFN
ncbi:MAG: hypothetical protein AAB316_18140 [Bacteroidota bacterium]